ncbi:MAG: protocatechuate 4,5-dioxygenase subunit alpha [Elusimicrobiota bacterium]|jgi:protocatechuate 4,5-dioxygenase alpha chain
MRRSEERDYDDIPGTYVFDGIRCREGFRLNMFCKSLDRAGNRDAFRIDPQGYLASFQLSDPQRLAVVERDWLAMLRFGGNIYYTFKLAIFDGLTMQHVGAAMSEEPMSVEEFRAMMMSGGRTVTGNRSKRERKHG